MSSKIRENFYSAEIVDFNKSEWNFQDTPVFKGEEPKMSLPARAVALGVFNGIHLGHRAVITKSVGVDFGAARLISTVLTFTSQFGIAGKEKDLLVTEERRDQLLKGLGVNDLISLDFESVRDLSPEEFVSECLVKGLNAKRVCCGNNYHFGKGGSGNVETLSALCEKYDIALVVVPPVSVNGELVSSTRIRAALAEGNVREASRLLGYAFGFDFPVVDGQHLGRTLGTPTINQPMPEDFVWPKFGVYASAVLVDGEIRAGVTNVGRRPTVGSDYPLSETWIADYSGDLYGKNIPVFPVKFLRGEKRFDSVEALKNQILSDGKMALDLFSRNNGTDKRYKCVLFDFDDTLQDRKAAFSSFSQAFINKHFPQLSPQEAEARAAEMVALNKGGYVNYFDFLGMLIERWGWDNSPSVESLVYEIQMDFPTHSVMFEGAVEMVQALKQRGYLIGMITNGPSLMQNRKVDYSGIRHLFDIVTVAGDEGVQKPKAEVFKRTAYKLGIAPEDCIFAGDHPVNDIKGALSAGMDTIYINPAGNYLFGEELEILESNGDRVRTADSFEALLKML